MRQDRLEVLKMLAEGKISVEEAELLLRALDEPDAPEEQPDAEGEKPKQGKEFVQEMTDSNIVDITDEQVDQRWKIKQKQDVFKGTGIAKIEAQTANGRITLEGSDRDGVTVRAWKEIRGRGAAAAEFAEKVEIYAEQIGDELQIFTDHPPLPKGVNLAVRYAIETPREIDVNLRIGNSRIEIGGISGAIDTTTANGTINLRGDTGPIRARATNGTIRAEIGLLANDAEFSTTNGTIGMEVHRCIGSVAASTTNGPINLTLPADFAGQLDAEARRGRVHSDFPIPVVERIKNQLKGEIGEGGEAIIKLRSMNGSIRLERQEP